MNKRTASLLVLVVLVSLLTFGSESQSNSTSAAASSHAAAAKTTARKKKSPTAPPTNIGFLSPTRAAANGAIPGIFPAVMGDFEGNGNEDAATMVNVTPGSPSYSISAAINDGTGNFTTVLTKTPEVQQDPIFVADLNGDGKDDVLLVHPATSGNPTYIQAWLSNGDGTFKAVNSGVKVTTTGFVWATVTDVNGDGCPDVVLADSATPNGNIWTVLGKGDGTCDGSFGTPTSVAFTGAISPGSPTQGVPGNPMVFGDFNGDGFLDFAAPAVAGGSAQANQVVEYLCTSGSAPCTTYAAPVLLTTSDAVYDSCFLGSGNLGSTTAPQTDLISANCLDGNVTVYVNNGSGSFGQGVYYFAGARPAAVSVADVNGDGNGDLIVTDLNSAAIKVLAGNGDGTVGAPTVGYVTGGSPVMPALIGHFGGASNPVGAVLPDNQTNFVYLAGYGDGSFRSGINYYAETTQGHKNGFQAEGVGLASGDFNGDGIPDFVIGNANGGTNTTGITVFIANADGSLQTGVNYFPAGTKFSLQYVTVGDFNGDGKLDIAASDTYNGVIQIFYGNGDSMGTFTTGPTYPSDSAASPHPVGIVTADFNGDGKPDLAFVNNTGPENAPTGSDVGILINNGAGGFNSVVNTPLSTVATELTAADVNGDGKLDVVVPLYGVCSGGSCSAPGSAVAVLLGNGDGTLTAGTTFNLVNGANTYFNPYHAAVGDLNGDGKADLAVTIQNVKGVNQGIAVALGNGDGTFQTPTLLPSSPQNPLFVPPPVPGYVKIADLNRDGHMDLVYTNAVAGSVGVMYGVGDGTFYTPVDFPANRWAWDFALVDVNGDGALDVVASGFEQSFSGVGVLLNTSGSSTALKSSLPHSVAGQSVTFTATITGSPVKGVTTTPTGTITFFNGTTQLGAPVPISSGTASLSTTALPVGTDSITAQYSGDTNYVPTTSAALPQVVGQATSSTATPTSSVNPSALGQAVTFSTTVTSTVSGDSLVPTGTVNFNDGATLLGPGTLNSSGVAAFTTSKLAAGTHSITAVYAGDTNFTGSTSGALSQVVSSTALPASYTLTATPTTQTVSAGSSATYSIKVNPTNYTGTVTFACPTTLPTGVTCTPPGPSAPPYAAGTLTLKTTAATTAMMAPPANQRHSDPTLWASLMGVGMLGMVLAGDWKKRNRRALGIVLLVVALAMIMALAGCGGGSSSGGGGGGGGGNGGTPAGSYPITINATGTGITTPPQPQQLTVTLVVN
jgi:hypothetical protein